MFYKPSHAQMGRNPELRTIFYKLTRLLESCFVPVFVFDGPARPQIKHGRHVHVKRHWMTPSFQEMITYFGFYYHNVCRSEYHRATRF